RTRLTVQPEYPCARGIGRSNSKAPLRRRRRWLTWHSATRIMRRQDTCYGGQQMPTTKLTLTVKPEVVKMAKQYARRHNTSVSATFSRVIRALVGREQDQAVAVPAGSALEKLSGIITLPEG